MWLGDSYTAGFGTDPAHGYSCIVSTRLGWNAVLVAQGSTGFVHDGHARSPSFEPLPGRFAETAEKVDDPEVVIVDASRNDATDLPRQVEDAARGYLMSVRSEWPKAQVIINLPWITGDTHPGPLDAMLRTEARRIDADILDPIASGWTDDTGGMTIQDGIHPDQEGYAFIAGKLETDLAAITN